MRTARQIMSPPINWETDTPELFGRAIPSAFGTYSTTYLPQPPRPDYDSASRLTGAKAHARACVVKGVSGTDR
jgi:hypothetical protein